MTACDSNDKNNKFLGVNNCVGNGESEVGLVFAGLVLGGIWWWFYQGWKCDKARASSGVDFLSLVQIGPGPQKCPPIRTRALKYSARFLPTQIRIYPAVKTRSPYHASDPKCPN